MLVASGGDGASAWQVFAQQSELGTCLEIDVPAEGETVGRGFEVPERHDVAYLSHSDEPQDSMRIIAGPVVSSAATIRLEFSRGAPIEVAPVEPGTTGTRFFATPVTDRGPLTAVVALDESGAQIVRRAATNERDGPEGH